jgi:hypothetical protein
MHTLYMPNEFQYYILNAEIIQVMIYKYNSSHARCGMPQTKNTNRSLYCLDHADLTCMH